MFFLRDTAAQTPGWGGFISMTGEPPHRLTTIGYYPVIHNPITEYKTVQECLRLAEEATAEVGQEYTITTCDLGVCMKAYPLVWNYPNRYAKHIILIGTFHLTCAYFRMIGKKMDACGLSDVLFEAGLVGSGTIYGVLSGKNYSRAMVCHKTVLESLERLLLKQFLEERGETKLFENLPEGAKEKLNKINQSLTKKTLEECINDPDIIEYIQKYCQFQEEVANGRLGKTAQFWMTYMNAVWLVLQLHEAVKRNDFLLYAECIFLMPNLFFAYDGQNYARYMTMFSVLIANIDLTHPGALDLLKQGAFSVARSMVPGCRTDVDKTMEETFMKHSKSHGGASGAGISGITRNHAAYQRWVLTTHERSQYLAATFALADMHTDSSNAHRDQSKAEIKRSQQYVKKTMEAFSNFLNPFDSSLEKDHLYNISSGAAVSADIENDLLTAEEQGATARSKFVEQRLKTKESFFEPIKRMNLKTMASVKKKIKLTSSESKVVEYKHQGNIVTKLLVKSQDSKSRVDMAELMRFCITPVPYCIGTADGYLAKTNKATGFSSLTKDIMDDPLPNANVLTIEDGNALFYYLKEVPDNFKQICEKLYNMTRNYEDVIVSTDSYSKTSVKALERSRRGVSEKLIVKGAKTRRPYDWKGFLCNDDNKQQLIELMHTTWPEFVEDRNVILVKNGEAFHIGEQVESIPELRSNQEETDSRVVLYCAYAAQQEYQYVRVRTPDSDIFWILLHHARNIDITILFDTGHGNKKRLINITRLSQHYSEQMCEAMLGLHAFTGCDSVSSFKGVGKIRPLKLLLKSPAHCDSLKHLGEDWNVDENLISGCEKFTCALYGKARYDSVDEVRAIMLKSKCEGDITVNSTIDISRLPPSKACLREHIARANFQTRIWKTANVAISEIPKPWEGHGWLENGEPLWCDNDMILPQTLIDVLEREGTELEDSDDELQDFEYDADTDDSSSDED